MKRLVIKTVLSIVGLVFSVGSVVAFSSPILAQGVPSIDWVRQFGTSSDDEATGVAADISGSIYVIGFTDGAFPDQISSGGFDAFALGAKPTEVDISPPSQGATCGDSFSINVTVDPMVAIAGMQFSLSFDPSLLTANGVTEGNLLKQGGASTFFQAGTINNVAGTITGVACAIITPGASVSSPGAFATISFNAKTTAGTSALDLYDVIVGDTTGTAVAITVTGGSVTVYADWDVNMDGSINVLDMILVGQHSGETGAAHWIREDVNRDGIINVLDMIVIGQHWTGTVYADWDVNMDGSVNVLDMTVVGQHSGETGAAHWIREDVNRDGIINVLDMIVIGQHWTG